RVRHDVDESQLGIGGHGSPGGDVTGPLPRVIFPRVVAELTGPGDHVELPEVLAGARVVGEDVTRYVLDAGLLVPLLGRVADDHDVVDDDRRRRVRDVAEL